jgi:hypothetical protein
MSPWLLYREATRARKNVLACVASSPYFRVASSCSFFWLHSLYKVLVQRFFQIELLYDEADADGLIQCMKNTP